ncbi:hypothetical protein [Flavobacterium sp.]|uniref:hypothetical protein n=1 Tax=Flavobacterium sp. TaxID=239 RepID=UPI00286C7617|nr:hypothetical protein [Flavobacterium sp.]
MKKPILSIISLLFCIIIFAQETKQYLFIGTFEKNKRGICSDYELVHEEIKDYADYNIKRIQFQEEHKSQSPNTRLIDKSENVIAYQYEKKIAGCDCNSNVISTKTSKSIEDCYKQFAEHQAKYPKDFTTQPKIIFTWQGKGDRIATYSEDFGGLSGKFSAGNTATKTIIVAQLTNNTTDKLACVTLKIDDDTETMEYIHPSNTFSKKYDTKKLDVKVIYLDNNVKPTAEVLTKIKNNVRKLIINENGTFKTKIIGSIGVRG